ncbi:MAG: hybrid sensor histidine kinase/response regulator [Pseudomonadota bacterium]
MNAKDKAVHADRAAYLYGNSIPMIIGDLVGYFLLMLVCWTRIPHQEFFIWSIGFALVPISKFYAWLKFRNHDFSLGPVKPLMVFSMVSAFLCGLVYIAGSYLFFYRYRLVQEADFCFALYMLGALTAVYLASHYILYLLFFLPYCLATPVFIALSPGPLGGPFYLAVLAGPLSAAFAWAYHRALITSFELEFQNGQLVNNINIEKQYAEAANLAKTRFLDAGSHDLSKPLKNLQKLVNQLKNEPGAAQENYLIQEMDSSISIFDNLFEKLLDISKLDAAITQPQITNFPISHLLKSIEAKYGRTAEAKKINFRIVASDDWVNADPVLLEKILRNLVANAIQFTDVGGVLLGCRHRDGRIRIDVWDTGCGMADDKHAEIFGEFYQVPGTKPASDSGLGIGLAIVDRLCKLLDYPITVHSTIGKGSRFSVLVPTALATVSANEGEAQNKPTQFIFATPLAGKLIVVIDDDISIRDSMCGLLKTWGCEVIGAQSAEQAIDLLGSSAQPDLIISDYHLLDGETGHMAIGYVNQFLKAAIPAIIISGDSESAKTYRSNVHDYALLVKPVMPLMLRALMTQKIAESCA